MLYYDRDFIIAKNDDINVKRELIEVLVDFLVQIDNE